MNGTDVRDNDTRDEQAGPVTARTRLSNRISVPLIALVLAVGAMVISGWAALRPITSQTGGDANNPSAFDDAARSAAKEKTCAAFETVRRGVSLNTNASAPGGSGDVAGGLAVAANARLALLGGGEYLLARLDPAVPTELEEPVRQFADTLLDIGATAISGVPTTDPVQAERLRSAEHLSPVIANLCK